MKKIKIVAIGVIVGVVMAGLFSSSLNQQNSALFKRQTVYPKPYVLTGEDGQLLSLQNSFIQIAKLVKPAVVQITTEKTVTYRYWDPFQEFGRFFGGSPMEEFFSAPKREQQRTYERKQQGLGSGFIVDEDGYILTNNHVIAGVDKIIVKLLDDSHNYEAKIIGTDPKTDLALVKIETKRLLSTVRLADSDRIEPGEWVMAIGNPMGLTATVTVGIVSAKGRSGFGVTQYEDFIQTDAAINPGNSGGPLININGEVIGVNTFIVSPAVAEGLGFAIPINIAKQVFAQLKEKGKVVRGYLGVTLQSMDEEIALSFGLKEAKGALVTSVVTDSPAGKANIQEKDVILKFDGQDIQDVQDLQIKVAATPIGKNTVIVVWRDKKEKSLSITIAEMPTDEELAKKVEKQEQWRGMTVAAITSDIKGYFNLKETDGVVVVSVEPGSPSEESGIVPGVIIKEIDVIKTRNIAEYNNAIKKMPAEKSVRVMIKKGEQSFFVILKGEK
ncbi:MAG: Do family serine endopeptidase [Elusimicrobia bacterium]|nr:Do family serine endopeptidase [Elusimicrobiota bacterium]